MEILLGMHGQRPTRIGGFGGELEELHAAAVDGAEVELKIGEWVRRVDHAGGADGAVDGADAVGPLGMMRAGVVLDEARGGKKSDGFHEGGNFTGVSVLRTSGFACR